MASEHDPSIIVTQQNTQSLHRTPYALAATPASAELPADPRDQRLGFRLQVLDDHKETKR